MANQERRWLLDYEVEAATGGRISTSRLRKDRVGKQIFPFHRVGRSCFYDLREIHDIIESSKCGGKVGPAPQAKGGSDARGQRVRS